MAIVSDPNDIISLLKRHRVTDRIAIKDHRFVSERNTGFELGDRLVGTDLGDFHLASDGIARPNRRLEIPIDLKEHCTWAG